MKEKLQGSKIPTPSGWVSLGDLKVGDFVFGSDGKPTKVLEVHQQKAEQLYTVSFNDGTFINCGADHLWFTQNKKERRRKSKGSVKNTLEIAKTIFRDKGTSNKGQLSHQLSFTAPIQYPERVLSVDPYVLGALLGDGHFGGGVKFSTADQFILEELESRTGMTAKKHKGNKYDYAFTTKYAAANPLLEAIQGLGLYGNRSGTKFIPPEYLTASVDQRTALLQGLCDTDGGVNGRRTGVQYCTISPQLRDGIIEIVRSLGGRATYSRSSRKDYIYKGEKRPRQLIYIVYISFTNDIKPFKLPRKANLYQKTFRKKTIASVTMDKKEPYFHILVDSSDHMFVSNDCILTRGAAKILEEKV